MGFVVRKISEDNIETELKNIGFDPCYVQLGADKHRFLNLKIYGLTPEQATILKQTALSVGCDCGVNRGVLTHSVEKSDCVLSGSFSQIKKIGEKLKKQPFSLLALGDEILSQMQAKTPKKPLIMGILNLSEDSFSSDYKDPTERIKEIISQGADIIDIGAESTKPGALAVDAKTQLDKILPVLDFLKDKNIIKSVDTRLSFVADEVLKFGVDIINDVSFLNYDEKLLDVVLKHNKKLVLTHSRGTPLTMQNFCEYENVVDEIYSEFQDKINLLRNRGFDMQNLILDVGFGFSKNKKQNIKLIKHIEEFKSLGCEILVGTSRKSFLDDFTNDKNNENLDFLTSLTSFYFSMKNIDILRVHNVELTKTTLDFAQAIK